MSDTERKKLADDPQYVITTCVKCYKPDAAEPLFTGTDEFHVYCNKCGEYPARELFANLK